MKLSRHYLFLGNNPPLLKHLVLLLLLALSPSAASAQVFVDFTVDTTNRDIKKAVGFLTAYITDFQLKHLPDYSRYWRTAGGQKARLPDDMVYSISSDGPLYRFSEHPTVFFARQRGPYVQLKTLFPSVDSAGRVGVWAITNHYVAVQDTTLYFIPTLELDREQYRTVTNRNITYHFPKTTPFSKQQSDSMLKKLAFIEQQWGFQPVQMDYYFAADKEALARMRGLDYVLAMDDPYPSGISLIENKTIFCEGLGEAYLHEVLHQYFNPRYEHSPLNHGLIYYLAGGYGYSFDWMINRMNEYLRQYPETDLTHFEDLLVKDKMLHIDYTVNGLLCKMIDEKEGVAGLKRALAYKTVDEVFEREFGITKKDRDAFLRASFRKYGTGR